MRIGLVHAHAFPEVRRGGERYLDDLARYLHGAGHDVEVLAGTAGPHRTEVVDGIVHRRRRHAGGRVVRRYGLQPHETIGAAVAPALLRHRYDVVHALTETAALAGVLTGHRTVYTNLGHRDRAVFVGRRRDWLEFRAAARLAAATTAVSEASAQRITELTGRPAVGLPAGVRLDAFPLEAKPRSGSPRILFASDRSEVRKGLRELLHAMPVVLDHHPGARLVLAGPGDDAWALATLTGPVRERVAAAIEDVGPDVDLAAEFRSASVTALPSSHEALGLVLVESLASGTPVVAGTDGGPSEVAADPDVGRTVRRGDVTRLAVCLLEVIELARQPGTAERCAARARRWSWDVVGPAHEALYDRIRR